MRLLSKTLIVAALSAMALPPAAVGQTIVTQDNLGVDWFAALPAADTRSGGTVLFGLGPGAPPLGQGSVGMTTDSTIAGPGQAKAQLFNYSYSAVANPTYGTPLSSITALSYWAYRSSSSTNSAAQTISLNIQVDYAGNGASFTTLVFEPVYQPGGVGAMLTNTWQLWDAFANGNAVWWSTAVIPGVCSFNCFVSWNTILANNPSATVRFAIGFNIGSGWVGQFSGAADALTVGVSGNSTTYDFEFALAPMAMKQKAVFDLQALLLTDDKKTVHSIEKAIKDLMKSLDPDLWVDDSHLTDKGKKVFEDERQAVQELMKVKPPTPIAGIIVSLVEADSKLAQIAIDEAIAGSGDPKHLAKAVEEFGKATDAANAGDYDKAIEHFKKAWHHAMKALNKPVEP